MRGGTEPAHPLSGSIRCRCVVDQLIRASNCSAARGDRHEDRCHRRRIRVRCLGSMGSPLNSISRRPRTILRPMVRSFEAERSGRSTRMNSDASASCESGTSNAGLAFHSTAFPRCSTASGARVATLGKSSSAHAVRASRIHRAADRTVVAWPRLRAASRSAAGSTSVTRLASQARQLRPAPHRSCDRPLRSTDPLWSSGTSRQPL
jgi:hypothetical protein